MRRPSVHLGLLVVVPLGVLGVASCKGIEERLDVLRARRIELVDDDDKVTLDVGRDVRRLEERVTKLETELRAAKADAELAKATPAPTRDGGVAAGSADAEGADAGGRHGSRRGTGAPRPSSSSTSPDLF